jgi:thermitase
MEVRRQGSIWVYIRRPGPPALNPAAVLGPFPIQGFIATGPGPSARSPVVTATLEAVERKGVPAWPAQCHELVATLRAGTPEAELALEAPHHRRAEGFEPAELSSRLGALVRRVGDHGRLGRAFSAAMRESADPFSPAAGVTTAERSSGLDRVVRIAVDDPAAAARLAAGLTSSGVAEAAHPVAPLRGDELEPDDDGLPGLAPGGWAIRAIRADEALEFEPGHPDVVVAVLDTGVDLTHPEFKGRLTPGYDFVDMGAGEPGLVGDVSRRDDDPQDEAGHGTHVAGVIGARGIGMNPGVGGRCSLMPIRVLGTTIERGSRVGVGQVVNIDEGIKYAVDEGASVLNLSLGLPASGPGMPHRRAIEYARLNNVVAVAASGNDGRPRTLYPGAVPGVITVGAISELGMAAPFSSYGDFLDVMAPGSGVYSADLGGGYRYRSGTSHAAPFVAGVAALLIARARRRGLTLGERTVRRIIRESADRSDGRWTDRRSGRGAINALDAVLLCSSLIREHLERKRSRSEHYG